MKILVNRVPSFNPYGQYLLYDDGTDEFDYGASQTPAILIAEQHNSYAAKDDDGQWIPAPGSRTHEYDLSLLGFRVQLTYVRHMHRKAAYDYAVTTPTGVTFYGNSENNVLIVPSFWTIGRVVGEAVAWICVGEDSELEFLEDTTPEQWQWIRSTDRKIASAEIDKWIEQWDKNKIISLAKVEAWERAIAKSEQEASE